MSAGQFHLGVDFSAHYNAFTLSPPASQRLSHHNAFNVYESHSLRVLEKRINIVLAAVSVALFLLYTLRRGLSSLVPRWLRPFAAEEPTEIRKRRKWTHWTLLLGLVCAAGLAVSIVSACLSPGRPISSLVKLVPWLSTVLITALDRPTKTPMILFLQYFWMLSGSLLLYSLSFLDNSLHSVEPFRLTKAILSLVGLAFISMMPLRDPSWDVSDIGSAKQPPSYHVRSPEDNMTLFSFWSMSWVYPLAAVCKKREITVEDVWQLPYEFQHTHLYEAFRELHGRLIPCLMQANGLDLSISIFFAILEKVCEVVIIRLSSQLYYALDQNGRNEAYFWCLVMFCIDCLRQVCKTTAFWFSRKAYERSRGETFIALFGKLLTRAVPGSDITEKGPLDEADGPDSDGTGKRGFLSKVFRRKRKAKQDDAQGQPASNAKVVNLVRGDTYELSQVFWDMCKFISRPVKVIFVVYALIDIMGWPSMIGFGLMIVFVGINALLVRQLVKLERQRTAHSDKRAQAVSHFVEASRPLKLNGWTSSWSDRIMKFRAVEMLKRLQIAQVMAAILTVNIIGGAMYPLASIALYTMILRRGLPNDVIWPSLELFGHLEVAVKGAFENFSQFWRATIPVERVNKYMREPDRDLGPRRATSEQDIEFQDASFSWPSTDKLVLERLKLTFSTGLTVVRGKVGSGKSSLLLAALNEMQLQTGEFLRADEPIGYAQQLPWLQNKTIRDNIVFHQNFDSKRYRDVLHACALGPDLATFPDGDQTKLEEGGIGLSGGQKARVALARAVYSPCRILLLDDPLAALDHDTASTIVRRFLQGPLATGRTIVMVTHRDDLVLRLAQQVIDLEDGRAKVLSQEQIKDELEHPYHAATDAGPDDEAAHAHGELSEEVIALKDAPEEPAQTGSVSMAVYFKYMRAGGWSLWVVLAVFYGISRWCDIARARLLEAWGNETATVEDAGILNDGYWGLPDPSQSPKAWLYVLAGLSAGQVVTYAIAQVLLARISVKAASGLFKVAVDRISNAPFRYYDVTPTAQLKNRLISDMSMVDGGILAPLEGFVYNFIALSLSLTAIMTHQPTLLIFIVAVSVFFVYFFRLYVPISRCLRRMEMRYLTPIIANIGAMQDGLVTIRALRVEHHFQDRHLEAVEDFQRQDHYFWSMAFWLDFRLSLSSTCMRALLIVFMVWYGMPASAVGFVLNQTTIAIIAVQELCDKFAKLQLDAVSLERVDMLNRIPEEPNGDDEPPEDWPKPTDDLSFQSMSFRYDDGLPDVLREVSFEIPGGSTCAVLGRTGSGKSTIANALLATQTPSSGTVKVGSMDLSQVNRTTLRNRVTFIQQDPTLFPGTLRDNIDPEGRFSDASCANAIHRVLGPEWSLDSIIDAGGKNLSQGQRQLVGIGRAVLRRSGLVILDEATASIDRGTAAQVQRVLREELSQSTVITIAHRLEAVEHATWCLRLEHGKVIECGPANGFGRRE